jgi:hypothetical protein
MSKNFTDAEIEEMKEDFDLIILHNGLFSDGEPRYDEYAFDAASVNDKGIPKEEQREANDGDCGGYWRKKPAQSPSIYLNNYETQLHSIKNSNFENIFKQCFEEQNVSRITTYINNKSKTFKLPSSKTLRLYDKGKEKFNLLFSIDTGNKDRVELNFTDWMRLSLYLAPSALDLDMRPCTQSFSCPDDDNRGMPAKLLCSFNNLVDPSREREIVIKVSFKEVTSAILYFDKINIPDGKLLAKLKYHKVFSSTLTDGPKDSPGMQRVVDVKSSIIPALKMPADYNTQWSKKEAVAYMRNNLEKVLNLNSLTWNNFFKLFQNNQVPHNDNIIIQNKIKIANLLQDTINQIQGSFTVMPKCDNNKKVCKYTGYCYQFTDCDIINECYISSISIAQSAVLNNRMEQSTISIVFDKPTRDINLNDIPSFTDSDAKNMSRPYNLDPIKQENSSDANVFYSSLLTPTDQEGNQIFFIDNVGWVREWDKFGEHPATYVNNLNSSGRLEENVNKSVYVPSKDYTPNLELDPDDKTKKLIIIKNQ